MPLSTISSRHYFHYFVILTKGRKVVLHSEINYRVETRNVSKHAQTILIFGPVISSKHTLRFFIFFITLSKGSIRIGLYETSHFTIFIPLSPQMKVSNWWRHLFSYCHCLATMNLNIPRNLKTVDIMGFKVKKSFLWTKFMYYDR